MTIVRLTKSYSMLWEVRKLIILLLLIQLLYQAPGVESKSRVVKRAYTNYEPDRGLIEAIRNSPMIPIQTDSPHLDPMSTSSSHHHHKKATKGWLDMGAWTKKKGAFGWYADFPVGKGKK